VPDALVKVVGGGGSTVGVVLLRLLAALALGALVALIYRSTRTRAEVTQSFLVTLVLLAVLIAMVTQVIGDNVARAFSLVGALSIVRFRTVVRDTQDTAYVIFAVVVGMAIGASNATVAVVGLGVVGLAAFVMRRKGGRTAPALAAEDLPYQLSVRMGLGGDAEALLGTTLDGLGVSRQLTMVATARQGLALDVEYRISLAEASASEVVRALNLLDGVQNVALQRSAAPEP
jgi:hypothetical protein